MSQEEFFSGYSIPRNKELMRVFKDLEMVEYLGSGIPRILKTYSPQAFVFTENFIRIVLPSSIKEHLTEENTGTKSALSRHQVEILHNCLVPQYLRDIIKITGRTDRTKFRNQVLKPLIKQGLLEMTIPDKPQSSKQQYALTPKGKARLDYEA